jgi:hypothetical protein
MGAAMTEPKDTAIALAFLAERFEADIESVELRRAGA